MLENPLDSGKICSLVTHLPKSGHTCTPLLLRDYKTDHILPVFKYPPWGGASIVH